ncbi:hypothetical protein ABT052_05695 [Streptomyces sp. NPDC002766]|uniref:hypothetical protein n=1 Tax=Streptomyces sp. NPDC002766 TaxID=3154429 RepID=UPI00332E488B
MPARRLGPFSLVGLLTGTLIVHMHLPGKNEKPWKLYWCGGAGCVWPARFLSDLHEDNTCQVHGLGPVLPVRKGARLDVLCGKRGCQKRLRLDGFDPDKHNQYTIRCDEHGERQ